MTTEILRHRCYWAPIGNVEFRMSGEEVEACSHSGSCDADVAFYAPRVYARAVREIGKLNPWFPSPDKVRAELKEYGTWDDEELRDDKSNWERLVWLAAGNIRDSEELDCSPPSTPECRRKPRLLTFSEQVDARCRDPKAPTVARWIVGAKTWFIVIGTDYGCIHTSSGEIRRWGSYSAARRVAKAYRPL